MNRPFLLGLTGSIGMGKSTTARLFADAGVPVWDADDAVRRLYGPGAAGSQAIARLFPATVGPGGVDRAALKARIANEPEALSRVEGAIHPLVAADREAFVQHAARAGADLVVLDIPLLFETGADADVDATLVVTAPADVQRARVLARPGMTEEHFMALLSRQIPDPEKRARADHLIETRTLETARAAVHDLIRRLRDENAARNRDGHGNHRP